MTQEKCTSVHIAVQASLCLPDELMDADFMEDLLNEKELPDGVTEFFEHEWDIEAGDANV